MIIHALANYRFGTTSCICAALGALIWLFSDASAPEAPPVVVDEIQGIRSPMLGMDGTQGHIDLDSVQVIEFAALSEVETPVLSPDMLPDTLPDVALDMPGEQRSAQTPKPEETGPDEADTAEAERSEPDTSEPDAPQPYVTERATPEPEEAVTEGIRGTSAGTVKIARIVLPQAGTEAGVIALLGSGVAVLEVRAAGSRFVSKVDRSVKGLNDLDFRRAIKGDADPRSMLRFSVDGAFAKERLSINLSRFGLHDRVEGADLVLTEQALAEVIEVQNAQLSLIGETPETQRMTVCFRAGRPEILTMLPIAFSDSTTGAC